MLGLLIVSVLTWGTTDVELQTLGGAKAAGQLKQWRSESITLQTETGEVKYPSQDLLSVRFAKGAEAAEPKAPSVCVQMADGSFVTGSEYLVENGKATLTLSDGSAVTIPTRDIQAVRLKQQAEPLQKQWEQICSRRATSDLLVIRGNGESLEALEGVLESITADNVAFLLDEDPINAKREKVVGVVYYSARPPKYSEAICVVHGSGGMKLQAKKVDLASDKLTVTTLAGIRVKLPVEEITTADYSQGKILYLSEMKIESSAWKPYFGLPAQAGAIAQFGRPRNDASLRGGALQVGGTNYSKGIALRSRTELSYRIPNGFKRFTAIAGIDDRVRGAGHVRLVISGDGKPLYERAIAGSDAPLALDVDISGIRQMTILVDYGDGLDVADHLDLCEARISK